MKGSAYNPHPQFARKGAVIFERFPQTHVVEVRAPAMDADGNPVEQITHVMQPHPRAGKIDPESARGFGSINAAKHYSRTICGLGNVSKEA